MRRDGASCNLLDRDARLALLDLDVRLNVLAFAGHTSQEPRALADFAQAVSARLPRQEAGRILILSQRVVEAKLMRLLTSSQAAAATSLRAATAFLGLAIFLPTASLARPQDAQSQDSSVAEAARRSREKKKNATNPAKSAKVITDDDLDKRNFQPGQSGVNVGAEPKLETEPPSPQAVAAAEAADKAAEQQGAKDAADQDAELAKLKEQIADAEKDLDLAQRQLALDSDSYYSNPDYQHDTAGQGKLDGEKQQITDKQQEIERLKTRLAALEELKSHRKGARKQAAAPPQKENPPAAPPQR